MSSVSLRATARRAVADRWTGAALLAYVVTTLILTWPMPVDLTSRIYGNGGDAFLALGSLREANDSGVIPLLPGKTDSIDAPEGRAWEYPTSVATWAVTVPRWLISLAIGEVATWNLWVLTGFVFTGMATFLLVRKLTGSAPAAVIAGWAFAFYPFAAIRAGAHVEFSHGWLLVLVLWRALELHRQPTRRNGLWMGAALVLYLSYTPYYVLIGGVTAGALVLADLVLAWRNRALRQHMKAWAWGLWMVPVLLALFLAVNLTLETSQLRSNSIDELYLYSARPIDYLVPVPGSGFLARSVFQSEYAKGIASGERGLYLGWSVLLFALVGAVALARKTFGLIARKEAALVAFAGVVALGFSAVPTVNAFGRTLYLPSWFVFHLTSSYRVYARFVVVVMLAACVLAGYGIAAVIRRRPRGLAVVLVALMGWLVVSDLYWRSDPATIALPDYPIYRVLAEQRDKAIAAEYPLFADEIPDKPYALEQDRHGHRLLNGYPAHSDDENRALWLGPLADPDTAPDLARLGVGWVILNEAAPPPAAQPPGTPGRGFQLVARKAGRSLWRVTAKPARAQAYGTTGFGRPEGPAGSRSAWLQASQGTLRIDTTGCPRGCPGVLRFVVGSFAVPRALTVSVGGRVVARTRVPTKGQRVALPLRAGPRTEVELSVTPGPVSPRQILGTPDPRPLAVTVIEPHFVVGR